jgi:hypothetical protein
MTRNVTFGWINTTSRISENNIPTEWIGKRNLKLGSKNDIDIVVLENFDKYDYNYTNALENVGYNLINATDIFRRFSKKYSALNRFGDYEKKCFLRWLILEELYSDEPVVHYDGDIVFNETPENLQKRFKRKTFVLQGCPAVVSLNTHDWYNSYRKNLDLFVNNIEQYSADAWERRTGWEDSAINNWAGSRYRRIITSDQDLISHLIHVHELPQESPTNIVQDNRDLIFFENPLYFFSHNMNLIPLIYSRKGHVDYFNDRKAAFWHMQSDFCEYLKRAFFWNYMLHCKIRVSNTLEQSNQSRIQKFQNMTLCRLCKPFTRNYSRLNICQFFFDQYDLSSVFNTDYFWTNPINSEDLKKITYL